MSKTGLLAAVILMICQAGFAQQRIKLYRDAIPGAKPVPADYKEWVDSNGYFRRVSEPELIAYFPSKPKKNGTAVIICPGGGYQLVVASYEGADVAKAFNEQGITAFVLKYRLPNDSIMENKTTGPLQDAQMAIKIVRERAAEWKLDPGKIGVVGLSAGGHLAASLGTHFREPLIANPGKTSLRPDFLVLIYPVITFGQYSPPRTKNNLLGTEPTQAVMDYFSCEKNVTAETPVTFLLHASDDKRVLPQNSWVFYQAMFNAGVRAELHLIPEGGHGFGVDHDTRKDEWVGWCMSWLKESGFK